MREGKRKAGWKVKQRDYNIQKANTLSFLACVQTPPSPQIFSEGRRGGGGVGHLYTAYSFQSPTVLFALKQGAFVPRDRFVQRTHLSSKYLNAYVQTSSEATHPVATTLTTPISRLYIQCTYQLC